MSIKEIREHGTPKPVIPAGGRDYEVRGGESFANGISNGSTATGAVNPSHRSGKNEENDVFVAYVDENFNSDDNDGDEEINTTIVVQSLAEMKARMQLTDQDIIAKQWLVLRNPYLGPVRHIKISLPYGEKKANGELVDKAVSQAIVNYIAEIWAKHAFNADVIRESAKDNLPATKGKFRDIFEDTFKGRRDLYAVLRHFIFGEKMPELVDGVLKAEEIEQIKAQKEVFMKRFDEDLKQSLNIPAINVVMPAGMQPGQQAIDTKAISEQFKAELEAFKNELRAEKEAELEKEKEALKAEFSSKDKQDVKPNNKQNN